MRMPRLLPAPMPRFSWAKTRTRGKRVRTSSRLPSVEPWSTTIVSSPATDSRHRSSHGSALNVTTMTETSPSGIRDRGGCAAARTPRSLPQDHAEPWQSEHHGHHEEEEAARERRIGRHGELAEEVDEERLAHGEPVDCERHQHDEEEQRPEHDVGTDGKLDPDRVRRGPDGGDARELCSCGDERDDEQRPKVLAVAVDSLVDEPHDPLDADTPQHRDGEPQHAAHPAGEEDDAGDDRQHDEE